MKKALTVVVLMLLTALVQSGVHAATKAGAAGTVKVTVTYKGKGTVDASHKLWVWIFDTPNIGAGSMPIDQVSLDANGAQAVFENVAPGQVWIAVAFDQQGAMMGDAPPPTGSPVSVHAGKDGMPLAVTPGEKGLASITFDDSMRMP